MLSLLLDVSSGTFIQFFDSVVTVKHCCGDISYSFPLALYSRNFTTSVVLGNDMIPR